MPLVTLLSQEYIFKIVFGGVTYPDIRFIWIVVVLSVKANWICAVCVFLIHFRCPVHLHQHTFMQ